MSKLALLKVGGRVTLRLNIRLKKRKAYEKKNHLTLLKTASMLNEIIVKNTVFDTV